MSKLFSILFFCFIGKCALAAAPLALIYNGPGACEGCGETIGDVLQELHFNIKYVGGKDSITHERIPLSESDFAIAKLFVQPGGSDRIADTLESFHPGELALLRNFVFRGGKYLGVCAGAYLAATRAYDDNRWINAYGLVHAHIDDEDRHRPTQNNSPRLEPIGWIHSNGIVYREMYFQDGPSLIPEKIPGAIVYARYAITGDVAALIAPSASGFVGLIGPHPEADNSWFDNDSIPRPTELSRDLFKNFIRDLMKINSTSFSP